MTIRNNAEQQFGGASRAMFASNTHANPMLRGPMVAFEADDGSGGGNGGGGDDAAAAAAAAEEAARLAEEEAARKAAGEGGDGKSKPSDAEAKLLKEVMKNKKAAEDAKKALDAANAKLRDFDGLNAAELRQLIADKAEAERKEAEKRGEYDRIIAEVTKKAKEREDALQAEHGQTKEQLAAAQRRIDDLTVGYSFTNSKFLSGETVLSGDKARRLYGDHFEIEDGEVVAYDKPRGASERTPLVDGNGTKLSFEAAIEKIVKSDPDFESIAKSKMRPGSNSTQTTTDKGTQKPQTPALSGKDRIAAVLNARRAAAAKK